MKLYEELYFDITVSGEKAALRRFADFLRSGALDDFFEISNDYIIFADNYGGALDGERSSFAFTNDDMGIPIDEIDPEEILEVLCRASRSVEIRGSLYDLDEGEYTFISAEGDTDFINARSITRFNDELDEQALEEEDFGEDEDF